MMTRTHHTGFVVSDMDRAVEFYTILLGTGPTAREFYDPPYVGELVGYPGVKLEYAIFPLPDTDAILELVKYISHPSGQVDMETNNVGMAHLCLVSDDIQADWIRLVAAGGKPRSDMPVDIPVGPYAGGKIGYLQDPDGITIELIQLTAPAE